MDRAWNRRELLLLFGVGGVAFASGLPACSATTATEGSRSPVEPPLEDFFFLQLSDTHWGFSGAANPEADRSLKKTVAQIEAIATKPDLIVFTGDLTHITDDDPARKQRMREFKEIVAPLASSSRLVFLPGEHDAAPDRGDAYREAFGELHQSFVHKGVHFVAIDNASMPGGTIGDEQLAWLAREIARVPPSAPLVVLAHKPLFDLYPEWDWATKDGARAIEILSKRGAATVFYGHIHQENHHVTGSVAHHAARSLVFPLPAPGSVPKKAPLPWDASSADHGLGFRTVHATRGAIAFEENSVR